MDIRLEKVSKYYKSGESSLKIIDQLSCEFKSGCSVGIVGRSGIGKSTLLQLLGTLDLPSEGKIFFGGQELSGQDFNRRAHFRAQHIGFIFQFHHLLPEFSMLENVAMPLIIAKVPSDVAKEKAESILTRLKLKDRLEHFPSQLSGGEQQRVAIARALVHDPAIVLADEPTGNLDVETANEISEVLFEVKEEFDSSLIVVTHSHDLAKRMEQVFEMDVGGQLRPVL